jgi:hypothetical protein
MNSRAYNLGSMLRRVTLNTVTKVKAVSATVVQSTKEVTTSFAAGVSGK